MSSILAPVEALPTFPVVVFLALFLVAAYAFQFRHGNAIGTKQRADLWEPEGSRFLLGHLPVVLKNKGRFLERAFPLPLLLLPILARLPHITSYPSSSTRLICFAGSLGRMEGAMSLRPHSLNHRSFQAPRRLLATRLARVHPEDAFLELPERAEDAQSTQHSVRFPAIVSSPFPLSPLPAASVVLTPSAPFSGNGIFAVDGETWHQQRKVR